MLKKSNFVLDILLEFSQNKETELKTKRIVELHLNVYHRR